MMDSANKDAISSHVAPDAALPTAGARFDVVILGGGLAGLTLARQLAQERPTLRTFVIEKRTHPAPEAAFKVGESTVEISAHYFGKVLGLAPHMAERQLDKLGLRYFFSDGSNQDITRRFELGARYFPRIGSYQLDRGRLENYLFESNVELGVTQTDRATVRGVTFGDPLHTVTYARDGAEHTVQGRWVVDATGRSGFLKRQLGLRKPSGHLANAAWWRVKGRVKLDDWSSDPAWQARVDERGQRWLSTNHLMGPGYWFWLIPLASDSTSLGIVADAAMHPYNTVNRLEKAYEWLDKYEPQASAALRPYGDNVEDFLALQHFAHSCERVFSGDRWCLTGESGVFTDPFYSPGSDFIGIGNDFICELVERDADGEDIRARAEAFNRFHLQLFEAYIKVYELQYPIMGHARVMTTKVAWDNACYWGVTALLFFQRKYRDLAFLQSIERQMLRFFVLHTRMQQYLRDWHLREPSRLVDGFANVIDVDFLRVLQDSLDAAHDETSLRRQLDENLTLLERFAQVIKSMADQAPSAADQTTILPPSTHFDRILTSV
jgi:flavin-dependent dehydrogenase